LVVVRFLLKENIKNWSTENIGGKEEQIPTELLMYRKNNNDGLPLYIIDYEDDSYYYIVCCANRGVKKQSNNRRLFFESEYCSIDWNKVYNFQ
jgi:hypothetical protein